MQFDFSRLHEMTVAKPHPLGNMPLLVLTAGNFDVAPAPDMTAEQAHQDHLRLQSDLTKLSTNSRQIMVSDSGHEIYIYKPEVVVRSITAVVSAAKDNSRLPSIQ